MAANTDMGLAGAAQPLPQDKRAAPRAFLLGFAGLLALVLLMGCGMARADLRRAEVIGGVADGFARIVVTFPEEIETQVRQSSGILIIAFKEPFAIDVDRLAAALPGYVSAVRRDPDGTAVRFALTRKVTINTMAAGERLFVDLLPEGWSGLPPGLPRAVIEDLARRARAADKLLRQRSIPTEAAGPPIHVRVASLPTFTRFTFDVGAAVAAGADREAGGLGITFGRPLAFDLSDARAALPATVRSIEAETRDGATTVRFTFAGEPEIRSFREEGAFVVDVGASSEARFASATDAPAAAAPAAPAPAPLVAAQSDPRASPAGEAGPGRDAESPPPLPHGPARPFPPPAPPFGAEAGVDPPPPAGAAPRKPQIESAPTDVPRPPPVAGPRPEPPRSAQAVPSGPGVSAFARVKKEGLEFVFPFREAVAAAVFRRGDVLWLVFDSEEPIDLARLKREAGAAVLAGSAVSDGKGQVVRLRLDRPYLASVGLDSTSWVVTLGETAEEPSEPLVIERVHATPANASAVIPFPQAHSVHAVRDSESGARLFVVTGSAPARGLVKGQEFVEFRALASVQGLVVEPLADDVTVEAVPERAVVARPGGLTLSPGSAKRQAGSRLWPTQPPILDVQSWSADRQAEFRDRRTALMNALSDAPEPRRNAARIELARFFLARDLYAEAKGPLDIVIENERDTRARAQALVLRAVTNLMMGRPGEALKDLVNPIVGNQHDAQLWRALALSRLGRFAEARAGLRNVAAASAGLPVELQRFAIRESVRCALEAGDFAAAATHLNEFDAIGAPREMTGALAVLSGRVAEGLGKIDDALGAYTLAAESLDAPAAAEGKLRRAQLRHRIRQIPGEEAAAELEQLTTAWRGDETELEALQLLATLYTEADRFRDAFQVMRVAVTAHPGARLTQRIQEQAAKTFETIFLGERGVALAPAEALALFYDFRALTPPGERGDEMIRRLAERLIGMDLLRQAGELLQHQVEHRLKGAKRAEVAARLATVYLMDRKPEYALSVLRATRMSDLPGELRRKRLLLESRALSDVGRQDLALEIVQDMRGREVERLRADIHWSAQHWRLAAEHIERLYGERWRDLAPLDAYERTDILRAAIGYALAEDTLGLDRFREKFAAKMAEGPDRRLFEILTAPLGARSGEFAEVAKSASSIDTLGAFLRDLRARFPEPENRMSAAKRPQNG
ncbi:MAG TPA: tetratricopeptide repeat protein [Xanthobacteraceae bacterium]|nr:tetratricopeptide repeat protein [Xanthobacteraceae bacterium]